MRHSKGSSMKAPAMPTQATDNESGPPVALSRATVAVQRYLPAILVGLGAAVFLLLGVVLLVICLVVGQPAGEEDGPDPTAGPPGPRGSGKKPAVVPLTPRQKKINASVERGTAYLRQRQAAGGQHYSMGDREGGAH